MSVETACRYANLIRMGLPRQSARPVRVALVSGALDGQTRQFSSTLRALGGLSNAAR